VAKPSKNQSRRAVVEQMRREQQRAEKRRTYIIIAVCAVVGLAIIAAGAYPLLQQQKANAQTLEAIGVPASQAGCQDIVTKPATGNNEHKAEGTKIFYPDAPPAFGAHYPIDAPIDRKFYTADDRPKLEYLVHNLEHGYTILWYDSTVADSSDQVQALKAIAHKFDGTQLKDKFIVAPWTDEDGKAFPDGAHVALTHWSMGDDPSGKSQVGVWQYCQRPSGEVVSEFVKKYPYTDSPEPTAM
jgi:hypothetical protein